MSTGACHHSLNSLSFSITAGAQNDYPEGLVSKGSFCFSDCYSNIIYSNIIYTRNNFSLFLNLPYIQGPRFWIRLQSKIKIRLDIPNCSMYKPRTISSHHAGATCLPPTQLHPGSRQEAIRCLPQLPLSGAAARIDKLPKEALGLPRGVKQIGREVWNRQAESERTDGFSRREGKQVLMVGMQWRVFMVG